MKQRYRFKQTDKTARLRRGQARPNIRHAVFDFKSMNAESRDTVAVELPNAEAAHDTALTALVIEGSGRPPRTGIAFNE